MMSCFGCGSTLQRWPVASADTLALWHRCVLPALSGLAPMQISSALQGRAVDTMQTWDDKHVHEVAKFIRLPCPRRFCVVTVHSLHIGVV